MAESDYLYYQKLWQKSFLIEIHGESGELIKSFAFSLPPESVRFEYPQRVNITKTFGGVFVDDYGVDNAQISISGSTGNTQIKEVFVSGNSQKMTGKAEAYHIIEEILQYKRRAADYDKYEMRLYDLSSAPAGNAFKGTESQPMAVNAWIVVLKDGEISRSKDKPLFFSYSMQFLGVAPLGKKRPLKYPTDSKQAGQIAQLASFKKSTAAQIPVEIANTKENLGALKKALAGYKNVVGAIKKAENWTNEIEAKYRSYYRVVRGYISQAMGTVNSVFEIARFPHDIARDLIDAMGDVRTQIESVWPSIEAQWTDVTTKYDELYGILMSLSSAEDSASAVAAAANGQGAMPEMMVVPQGSLGSTDALNADNTSEPSQFGVLPTYGAYDIVANDATRLDVLSMKAYGSPDYADTIAAYNGITGDSDIIPGMAIKIPYLSYTDSLQENEVYENTGNIYGSDIALDENNDLQLGEFNDYATVSGLDNMSQAINLRLSERNGARVRLDAYGISMEGGGFDSYSLAVMTTSVQDTLMQDPRIASVGNFSARIDGDAMQINFNAALEAGGSANFTMTV